MKQLIKRILKESTQPAGYFSDALRTDMIEEAMKLMAEDPEYNTGTPNYDDLLDPWDGYEYQTYIQNDLENNQIVYWEGWSKQCWDSLYAKPEYHGLSKPKAIVKSITERFPKIAADLGLHVGGYDYFFHDIWTEGVEDGYIMKVILKK